MPKSSTRTKTKTTKKSSSKQSHEIRTQEPEIDGPTPLYIPVIAIGTIVAGIAIVVLNFLGILPQSPQPQYPIVGLLLMCVGFAVATQIK